MSEPTFYPPPTPIEEPERMLGALDIVEAFTTLRHELKLQVRDGRELRESVNDRLINIERQLLELGRRREANSNGKDADRKLAVSLAEIEENLNRVATSFGETTIVSKSRGSGNRLETVWKQASWLQKWFSGKLFDRLRTAQLEWEEELRHREERMQSIQQCVELLLARAHRLMEECQIVRVDMKKIS